jgi:hypothetical protein
LCGEKLAAARPHDALTIKFSHSQSGKATRAPESGCQS